MNDNATFSARLRTRLAVIPPWRRAVIVAAMAVAVIAGLWAHTELDAQRERRIALDGFLDAAQVGGIDAEWRASQARMVGSMLEGGMPVGYVIEHARFREAAEIERRAAAANP